MLNKPPDAGGDINIITQTGIGGFASGAFRFDQETFIIFIDSIFLAEWRGHLRRFLSSLSPEVRHRDVADRLTQGTGKWFLEHPNFEMWLDQEDDGARILCCVGDPGVGKTGLAWVI
jgi:hypothetical protein